MSTLVNRIIENVDADGKTATKAKIVPNMSQSSSGLARKSLTPSKPVIFQRATVIKYTEENLASAEKKFLQWEGVQTRTKFTTKEEEVTEWLEQVTQERIPATNSEELANSLGDGRILCKLFSCLVPGSVASIPDNSEDRVHLFRNKCRRLGVAKQQLFDDHDLQKNMVKVVYCLAALAEICSTKRIAPFFTGDRHERQEARKEWIHQQAEEPTIPEPNPEILEQLTSDFYAPDDDEEVQISEVLPTSPPSRVVSRAKTALSDAFTGFSQTAVGLLPKWKTSAETQVIPAVIQNPVVAVSSDTDIIKLLGFWTICILIWGYSWSSINLN